MTFRLKTIFGIAVIEAVTLSLLIWTSLSFLRTSNEKALIERASTTAVMFATMATDAVLSLDLASLESFIEELLKNPGVVYGRIISTSDGVLAQDGESAALVKPFAADTSYHSIDDGVFDVQSDIVVKGVTYGTVQLGLNVTALQQLMDTARNRITVLAVAEMALTAFFSLLLGAWLTRQLGSLKEGTRQISDGNLGYQIPIRGRDELAQTAATFNRMSMDLQSSYRQLNDTVAQMRRASRDLKMSEAKMRAVLENAVDSIVTIDEGGMIVSFNPAAEQAFGYPPDEVIGKNVKMLVPDPHKSRHDEYIRRYLDTGLARVIGTVREVEGQRKNGERFPLELGVSEILIENQRLFTGIVRDISRRKQTEEELRRHRENLEQLVAQRTRDLENAQQELVEKAFEAGRAQLAAMMLHSIGNAVTPLSAHLDTIRNSLPRDVFTYLERSYAELRQHRDDMNTFIREDPRGRRVFEYLGELIGHLKSSMDESIGNLEKMGTSLDYVGEILSLQQEDEFGHEKDGAAGDVNAVIETALKIWEESLHLRGITVYKNLEAGLPVVSIEPKGFLQVLIHVIKNAGEAIAARTETDAPRHLHVSTYSDEDHITVEVRDTGIGIESGRLQELVNSKPSQQGLPGLGLYFSRIYMQRSNGRIAIESPGIGQGTTLKIIFRR